MIRITHVINNLQTGGAEMTLLRLMERLDRTRFEPSVIAMIGEGTIGPRLRDLDVPVVALGAARRRISVGTLLGVRRRLHSSRPDIIQSWMYHSNLAAYLARFGGLRRTPLAWNIRHSLHYYDSEPWLTRKVIRACARRSARVDAVIVNSTVSMKQHQEFGYRCPRSEVIPNGFDLEALRPVAGARERLRSELGIPRGALLVGCAGRYHPVKDHASVAASVQRLVEGGADVHLAVVGRGCEAGGEAEELRTASRLGDRIHLLPERNPLAPFLSGLDAFVVGSRSEGFPNVLAEAMACEVPCVTTDVGDAAKILGDERRVIPPGDVDRMSHALQEVLDGSEGERRESGVAARKRILDRYSIEDITRRYEALWSDLAEAS
jgi:glycosyltransferase involved in cell wall biosynthesis